MAKRKLNVDRVWVVISSEGFHSAETTFDKAKNKADGLVEDGSEDVRILEVVGAWDVFYPEEPYPEAHPTDLSNL